MSELDRLREDLTDAARGILAAVDAHIAYLETLDFGHIEVPYGDLENAADAMRRALEQ